MKSLIINCFLKIKRKIHVSNKRLNFLSLYIFLFSMSELTPSEGSGLAGSSTVSLLASACDSVGCSGAEVTDSTFGIDRLAALLGGLVGEISSEPSTELR